MSAYFKLTPDQRREARQRVFAMQGIWLSEAAYWFNVLIVKPIVGIVRLTLHATVLMIALGLVVTVCYPSEVIQDFSRASADELVRGLPNFIVTVWFICWTLCFTWRVFSRDITPHPSPICRYLDLRASAIQSSSVRPEGAAP